RGRGDDDEALAFPSHRLRGVADGGARGEGEEFPFHDVLRVEEHSVRRNVEPELSLCPLPVVRRNRSREAKGGRTRRQPCVRVCQIGCETKSINTVPGLD